MSVVKSGAAADITSPKKAEAKTPEIKAPAIMATISTLKKPLDPAAVTNHVAVNAQVLLRGIGKTISQAGKNPISLFAKNSVKRGLEFRPRSAGVAKKSKTRKEVGKSLLLEMLKKPGKPSDVVMMREVAHAKTLVHAEVFLEMTS